MKDLTKVQKKILTAFYRMRKKKSLAEIKVTELCALAEISHASFYKYYTDIYDLNRWQEDRSYYETVIAKADLDDMKSLFQHILAFLWKNHNRYQPNETYLFLENIHTYNIAAVDFFFPEKKNEIYSVLPLYIAVQTQTIAYLGTLRRMGYENVSERDYAIMEELWFEGIEKLKKYTQLDKNDRNDKNEETMLPLMMLVANMKNTKKD